MRGYDGGTVTEALPLSDKDRRHDLDLLYRGDERERGKI